MGIYRGTAPLKAYKGDMQPVNIYKGSTKIAGWHAASFSGQSPLAVDCDYNVPPDALTVDGKCVQVQSCWGTNLITNGDFSNGTKGWSAPYTSNFAAINNIASFTAAVRYGQILASIQQLIGHKYYSAAYIKADSVRYLQHDEVSGSTNVPTTLFGAFQRVSLLHTAVASETEYIVYGLDTHTSDWTETQIKYAICIDLTAAFGAGNEPTAAQMDAYLAAYPNSWFDGSALLTTSGTPNSPSPTYPAPITPITGDLTITAANGDLSDTAVTPLGSVELCSLPDGTKDTYDAVTGVVTKRVGKFIGSSGTSWTLSDAATDGAFVCDKITAGNLSGQTLSAPSACEPTVYYALATPTTVQLTPHLPVVRTGIKTLSIGADVAPTLSATVKSMD